MDSNHFYSPVNIDTTTAVYAEYEDILFDNLIYLSNQRLFRWLKWKKNIYFTTYLVYYKKKSLNFVNVSDKFQFTFHSTNLMYMKKKSQ